MKTLELNLQKRLLIVEAQPEFDPKEGVEYYVPDDAEELFILPKGTFKFICKGSELTEELATYLVEENSGAFIPEYKNYKDDGYFFEGLESFISSIEANGYYWGENPIKKTEASEDRFWEEEYFLGTKYTEDLKKYEEAQSRTFNPEKTIIFEIL